MAINLYVARTPLQLFNCREARERFHAAEENRLILAVRQPVDRPLVAEQLRRHRLTHGGPAHLICEEYDRHRGKPLPVLDARG